MSNLNTELMKALLENESIEEVFRSNLEKAVNDLLKIELTEYLGYEKSSKQGYNTGNSRNGFYLRELDTAYGKLSLKIPRDRNGDFSQQLIPEYSRRTDDLETTVISSPVSFNFSEITQAVLFPLSKITYPLSV